MKRFHYAWVICLACLWMYLCYVGLLSNLLTIYLPFIEATGISHSAGSAILSIRSLFSFLSTILAGWYFQKLSLRTGILIGALIGTASAVIFSIGGGPFVYYIAAALAGIGYGFSSVYPASILLANWFHIRRGLAFGISASGSGLAYLVFSPLLSRIILSSSLTKAFLAQAAFLAVSGLAVYLVVRDYPEDMGLRPYGEGRQEESARPTQRRAVPPLSPFLLGMLALIMLFVGGAGLSFSGHLSVLATTCGYAHELAAKVVSLFGFVLFASKMLAGGIADRIGPRNSSILFCVTFALGCAAVLGMNGINAFWYYVLAILLGIGAAICTVGPPLWAGELAPAEEYARTVKWLQVFYNLGGIVFNVVPGIIADRTGEYKTSFFLFAAMMLSALFLLLWAYRKQHSAQAC
ncbi:MAG: MFS transporter [Clostridia bacterium]|nr:MFS transporter [Clostridia bacterium]